MIAHLIAEEGPLKGLTLSFTEGQEWILGRNPDESDFVIEDSTVSRKHLRCIRKEDGLYLQNISRINPSLLNGEKISGEVLLHPGDRIQIGYTIFRYSDEEISEETPHQKKNKEAYDALFDESDEVPSTPSEEASPYDTIFEEGDSADIPFHLIPDSPLILKVISGPNAGAEIGIEKGKSYILGKDPNHADITFQDLSVSKTHARLSVSTEGSIEIEDLASKNGTAVNGIPIREPALITPQDMIGLGTTLFFLIDREAPQETIYSPRPPQETVAPIATPVIEETPEETEVSPSWKETIIPMRYLWVGGAFAAIFLIVFLTFFSLFKAYQVEMAHKEPSQEIEEALQSFPDIQFSFNPVSGKLFLVGHVVSAIDYQELLYRLDQIQFITDTEDTVIIDELIAKNMNDILRENASWKGVNIQPFLPGKFVANGYLATNAEAALLSDYLATHFPYLDRLKNQVVVEENLTAQISSLLSAEGFGAVQLQLTNGEVVLTGPYSEKEADRWAALVAQVNALTGVRSVKNFTIPTKPSSALIDLSSQYQVTGNTMFNHRGYSVVLNGKIYTLGDSVDGMKLIAIDPSLILFEKDGVKYKIDYTQ